MHHEDLPWGTLNVQTHAFIKHLTFTVYTKKIGAGAGFHFCVHRFAIAHKCAAIGDMIHTGAAGETTGPPTLRLYPVLPVGVDTMSPSAR